MLDFDIKHTTGLTDEQFDDLFNGLPSLQRNRSAEKARQTLLIYLMKLRTGNTNIEISNFFDIHQTTVRDKIQVARKCLTNDFVPRHLYHRSRADLIQHTTSISTNLYRGDEDEIVALVWDGTYIYCEKSQNYAFQKATYSVQKKRNLVKVMMCVSTDGLIAGVYGPYSATENDATILRKLIDNEPNAFAALEFGDVFILDRGFRDVVKDIQELGYVVKIPACSDKKDKKDTKKQFSVEDANKSRLVTKTRFIVEARNGHMKMVWKYFNSVKTTAVIPDLMEDFKIGAALLNAYFPTIQTDQTMNEEVANLMLERQKIPNDLHSMVKSLKVNETTFRLLEDDDFNQFPRLSVEHLKRIALGSYQIKNAPSYYQAHLKANNNSFMLHKCDESIFQSRFEKFFTENSNPVLILGQLSSRFRSKTSHQTFIVFDINADGFDVVVAYTCSCKNGLRTIGCCSHVMAVIWYLCHVNKENIKVPSARLDNIFTGDLISDCDSSECSEDENH